MSLQKYLINLKIRVKLLLAFGSLMILSAVLVLIFFVISKKNLLYQDAGNNIDGLNIAMLEMDGAVKYFMLEGYKEESFQKDHSSKYLASFQSHFETAKANLDALDNAHLNLADTLKPVDALLSSLDRNVATLQTILLNRGFKDFGLEGKLRKAIHNVENSHLVYDKTEMLMLRRHEKDFFLRKDLKYLTEFNNRIDLFLASVETSGETKSEISQNLVQYKSLFNNVAEIDKEIGLKDSEGFRGKINTDLEYLKTRISRLRQTLNEQAQEFRETSQTWLLIVFLLQMVLGVTMAIVYSNMLTRAVKELLRSMKTLAEGAWPVSLNVKSQDELGKTKTAFNQLTNRLKAASKFSDALGEGNLAVHYDEQFSGDILALSMTKMQARLKDALEKQRVVNWSNQGVSLLNDILKNEQEEIVSLSDKIISMLVQYLNANQGAVYILQNNNGEEVLERISTYAYDKKKFSSSTVGLGEGLVGECFLQKEVVVLKHVPDSYVKITSGLGEATPRFIVILPLLIRDTAKGVIEIASFEEMPDYQIDFLKKISENIASILISKQLSTDTKKLLTEAREREQRLKQSEEELQQNAEEMQAVQEQMLRQQQEMESEIAELRRLVSDKRKVAQINLQPSV